MQLEVDGQIECQERFLILCCFTEKFIVENHNVTLQRSSCWLDVDAVNSQREPDPRAFSYSSMRLDGRISDLHVSNELDIHPIQLVTVVGLLQRYGSVFDNPRASHWLQYQSLPSLPAGVRKCWDFSVPEVVAVWGWRRLIQELGTSAPLSRLERGKNRLRYHGMYKAKQSKAEYRRAHA